jgi:predicted phosphodiesterase
MHSGPPDEAGAPSYFSCLPRYGKPTFDPIRDAAEVVRANALQIDWIVCPGDLCDKGDLIAQDEAWSRLLNLRRRVGARKLIGTVGNHDVDSRRQVHAHLPDQALRDLRPSFPLTDQRLADRYWSQQYVLVKESQKSVNLVVLNTCAFHGVSTPSTLAEHNHGKIDDATLNNIRIILNKNLCNINILMMHHHPRPHPWLGSDSSHIQNGAKLLEILKGTGRRWLVIHGHQHLPDLSYADADPLSPAVLSAGSAAAVTYRVRGMVPRNQMYCVEFDLDAAGAYGDNLCGLVYAWDWAQTVGWKPAAREPGLPAVSGFGTQGGLPFLAEQIAQIVASSAGRRVRWADAAVVVPSVRFLVPRDLSGLERLLKAPDRIPGPVQISYDYNQIPLWLEME